MENARSEAYKKIVLISAVVLVITFLHYYTSIWLHAVHAFYRLLYYIPIIMAAFAFGMRGSVLTSITVTVLYLPQIVYYFTIADGSGIDSVLEVILYNIIAILTGSLIELEKQQKAKLVAVSEELRLANARLTKNIAEIEALQNYTNSIVRSVSDGIIAVNTSQEITLINQPAEEILKENGSFATVNAVLPLFAAETARVIKTNSSLVFQWKCKLREDIHPFEIKISPLQTKDREKQGAVLVIHDLFEVEKLQNNLRRSERLASLGQLTAGIAHEIRNPIGIIKTTVQLLQDEIKEDTGELAQSLGVILEETERVEKRISEFLDYARPGNYVFTRFNPVKLLEDAFAFLNKYLSQNKVTLRFSPEADLPDLHGDSEKLRQAFTNIILNAVQAMPGGGELVVTVEAENGNLVFTFTDTGVGIPEDKLASIFNPFFTTKDTGTGLGLPVTHRIIEDHRGTISVKSSPGKGTSFTITLPVEREE